MSGSVGTSQLSQMEQGYHVPIVSLDLNGPPGLLIDQINWDALSEEDHVEEKLAYYFLTTCKEWQELNKANFSSFLKEKYSSIQDDQLESSWNFFEVYKKARINGKFF